ncbi:hypothetical protein KR222_004305 [Zaprionus bogoriensis]|nr:hypothetical protein KR222_004305 [Zaprionus bogoriensis]
MEILNRLSGCDRPIPATACPWSGNKTVEGQKTSERMEKPDFILPKSKNSGFYFGLRPPGERETQESLAKALREQQKLEQKVREEYHLQRNARRSGTRRLHGKSKRARYEAAPAAAARLEQIMTTPSSTRVDKARENQNYPESMVTEAVLQDLLYKIKTYARRNNIDLVRQRVQSRNVQKIKRKRKTQVLTATLPETAPISRTVKADAATNNNNLIWDENKGGGDNLED